MSKELPLERRGGLCSVGETQGMKAAVEAAIAALDRHSSGSELTQSIEIPWIPPTLNDLLSLGKGKAGRYRLNKVKQFWTEKLSGFFSIEGLRPYQGNEAVWVEAIWYVAFRRDFDNLHTSNKFILDALMDAGIVKNDNLVIFQSPVTHWHERSLNSESDYLILTLSNTPRHVITRQIKYLGLLTDALDRF